MPAKHQLTLFVAGRRHRHVVEALTRLAQDVLGDKSEISVIDVLRDPDAAEENNILATPTLISSAGRESRRIIGDFANTEMIAAWLRSSSHHHL